MLEASWGILEASWGILGQLVGSKSDFGNPPGPDETQSRSLPLLHLPLVNILRNHQPTSSTLQALPVIRQPPIQRDPALSPSWTSP